MGKGGFGILIIMVLLIALLTILSQYTYVAPNDLRRTFSSKDAIRNGTKAVKEVLPLLFPDATIKTSKNSFARYVRDKKLIYNDNTNTISNSNSNEVAMDDSTAFLNMDSFPSFEDNAIANEFDYLPAYSYLFIDDAINFNKSDIRQLYKFVEQGNTVFIASADIPYQLYDSIQVKTKYVFFDSNDSSKKSQSICLVNKNIPYQKQYVLSEKLIEDYYISFDSSKASILAYLDGDKPIALRYKFGEGQFIFTTMHSLFLNQNLINKPERKVAYALLNYANAYTLIWDEYYKKFNRHTESEIDFIKNSKGLYAAYVCLLVGIVFYMIFEAKRRQREIKVINKPENSTLNFVHVITSLYRKNSISHKDIVKQKLLHWYDLLKNKLRIDTQKMHLASERLILSEKSGIDLTKINDICNQVKYLEIVHEITNKDLTEFDNNMKLFERFK
jgi:hypothetical protein